MAVFLLVLNFVGFAPTFFLKPLFDTPELPVYTHLHGALFASWFVLLFLQTALVARGNVGLHRRLGMFGAALAAAMVASGLAVLYFGVVAFRASGGSLPRASAFAWGNLTLLIAFASFVTLAMVYRRRVDAHKRLMLLATLSMTGQALARIAVFPGLQIGPREASEAVYGLGGLALLLVVVAIHDLRERSTLHPSVKWGCPLLLGSILVAALFLPNTGLGQGLVLLFE